MSDLEFDPARLERIEQFLSANYIDNGRLPCAEFTVLRRDEVAYRCALGAQNPEDGTPLADDTIYRIYSMTKPITSIAFMMLVEEGKIALDDPVHRYIPSWRGIGVYQSGEKGAFKTTPTNAPMRVVDLMRHTSGLTYDFQERNAVDRAYREGKLAWAHGNFTLEEFVEQLADIPLVASPGEAWNYSVSTDILGYLIQKVSDTPFDEFLQTRIFDRIGMPDTGFYVPDDKAHRLAACYTLKPGATEKTLLDAPETSYYRRQPKMCSGGGGLVSTTADYLQFVRMLLGRGKLEGRRLIAPKTLDLMTANHIPGGRDLTEASISLFSEAAYAGVGFGLGFAVTEDQPRTLMPGSRGDFFWGGMASTFFWVDPAEDMACIFMTQLTPSSAYPIRRQLRTLTYSALV